MGLFGPIWMTKNESKVNKAREEIFKIKDINKLKEIAIKAPLPSIKCAAAYHIEDDNVLKELYLNENIEHSHFQMNILSHIKNKDIINEIALLDSKKNDYYCAYNYISNDDVLRKIVLDDNFKITNSNYGHHLLLKAIKSINNIDDINKIIDKYSNDEEIVRLTNNQKDKLDGIKAYIGLCPICHKEIKYDIFWDFYDEKQKEKSNFECGCSKYELKSFKKCKIKKVKKQLEGNYIKICYHCGLPIDHAVKDYSKCTCGLGKYYLPINLKVEKQDY